MPPALYLSMPNQTVTIHSRKFYDRIPRTWKCELLERNDELLLLFGKFEQDVEHPGLGSIRRGTLSYEYYWLERWYNIFRFHEPDGSLRNYYCNIAKPPTFKDGVLDYVDLDIDIVVWPDGNYEVLDRDDFERNALKYCYPKELRQKAEESLTELIEIIEKTELPPPG